jgi:hypothetical protein
MTRDLRRTLRFVIVAAGIASLVGSGGGLPSTAPDYDGMAPWPSIAIEPAVRTAQVGTPVTFTAQARNVSQPSYQWCRTPAGGTTCETIPGATGSSVTLPSANMADDGTVFRVTVTDPNGSSLALATLYVSPLPAVVLQDGDFADTDWVQLAMTADPDVGGLTGSVGTTASGGNAGAFRQVGITLAAAPATILIEQLSTTASYTPSAQGAIRHVDFDIDCKAVGESTSNAVIWVTPLIEQDGRRFVAAESRWATCSSDTWMPVTTRMAIGADEFQKVAGPDCPTGVACPDFGPGGTTLRLGLAHVTRASAAASPGVRSRGFDNWRLTIWRR